MPTKRDQLMKSCQPTRFRSMGTLALTRRERGGFAVMTAVLIIVILGFCGIALDFSRMYNRKAELQIAADAIALAAAAELDGTEPGVGRALTAAAEAAARNPLYDYSASISEWSDSAIKFSAAPSGSPWLEAGEAKGKAGNLFYVQVDTGRLDARHGRVSMLLLPVVSSSMTVAHIGSRATAGRSTVNVLPLAICAMTDTPLTPGVPRGQELVELGFRRGISYNLMRLNPDSKSAGANFLINPLAPPGVAGTSVMSRLDVIEPFLCTGTMAMPGVTGGDITVERNFPLASVFQHLNSRFGSYTAPCTADNAPPDTNVKAYTPDTMSWMTDKPKGQSAEEKSTDTKLFTLAELGPSEIPADTTANLYGPLWIHAKAARYASYVSNGKVEPAGGYATLDADKDWSALYTPGSPKLKGTYPSSGPYKAFTSGPPGGLKGVADRRVLNVPLLRCPVPTGGPASAQVLGIGRFYMTVPATETDLFAEFAGLMRPGTLVGQVELYP